MMMANVFTREWRLVGTEFPDTVPLLNSQLLVFAFEEIYEEILGSGGSAFVILTGDHAPIRLNIRATYELELIPISESSLQRYYEFFKEHISNNDTRDKLIAVCRHSRKSPCFDITGCYLISTTRDSRDIGLASVNMYGRTCITIIPSDVIGSVIEYFELIDLTIEHERMIYTNTVLMASGYRRITHTVTVRLLSVPHHDIKASVK